MIRGRFSITIIVLICTTPCFVRAQIAKPADVSEEAWKTIQQHVPDAGRDSDSRQIYKYTLHNISPARAADVINLIFIGSGGIGPAPRPVARPTIAPNTPAFGPFVSLANSPDAGSLVGQVFSVSDESNNSVLIATKAQNWDKVKRIVGQLDAPQQQILIKAIFAEVTHDGSAESKAFFAALDRQSLFHDAASTDQKISTYNQEIGSTFQKLTEQGKAEILSRPYVLAKDGQRTSISLGRTETGIDANYNGGATARIDIVPHLAVDGEIVLDVVIDMRRAGESGLNEADLMSAVALSQRPMWEFAVKQGYPAFVHGYSYQHETTAVGKIPILGDLPLLGALFTGTETTKTNVEVVVMVTPRLAIRKQP